MRPVCSQEQSRGACRRRLTETVLVLALFLGGTALGMVSLNARHDRNGLTSIHCPDEFFGQSLMIAAGRGSVCPNIDSVPGLRDFIMRRANTFDAAALPANVALSRETSAEYHVYLIWAVAAVWRGFGISWLALEPFLALGLGLCAVISYGLFRLGMNRGLSVVGSALFVSSPAVLGQLNSLRDFSKAPFLLGGIFALGWLTTRKTPPRFLPAVAALMGLAAGVGMGFRQDAAILAPASLVVILALSPTAAYGTRRRRLMAALVYLAVFAAAAWPMLTRMEGGAQPYHPLAQGYSVSHLNRCSLEPGACEPLACSLDGFIFNTALGYARRATGNDQLLFAYNSPEAVRFTRDWVIATAWQFPADTLARVYGSMLNLVSGADNYLASLSADPGPITWIAEGHRRAAVFLRLAGPVLGVLALLAAAAFNVRLGIMLLLFSLYFCGYVSLDNEWRHTFHLTFVSFWAAGFVAQCVLTSARRTLAGTAAWKAWSRNAVVFAVLAVLFMAVPWETARALQRHTVDAVLQKYAAAPRTQMHTAAKPMRDWTLFQMEGGNGANASQGTAPGAAPPPSGQPVSGGVDGINLDSRCTLYAAHFANRRHDRVMMIRYGGGGMGIDSTHLLTVTGTSASGGTALIFFPAYASFQEPGEHFEGIAVPGEDASHFLGLYRIGEKGLPPLLPCATLDEPKSGERLCADIKVPYDPASLQMPETLPPSWQSASCLAEKAGRFDDALIWLRAYDAVAPSRENIERKAALYGLSGNAALALDTLKFLATTEGDYDACKRLDQFLVERMTPEQRGQIWESIVPTAEDSGQIQFHCGRALLDTSPHKAAAVLRAAITRLPGNREAVAALQQALINAGCRDEQEGDIADAVDAYEQAILANPANSEPCWRLIAALPRDNPALSRSLWDELRQKVPDNALVAALCGAAHAADKDPAGARLALEDALRFGGEDWSICAAAGDTYADIGAWHDAVATYGRALSINPGLEYLHPRLEKARKKAAAAGPSEFPAPVPPA